MLSRLACLRSWAPRELSSGLHRLLTRLKGRSCAHSSGAGNPSCRAVRQVDVFDAAGEQRAALSSEFQTAISPRNIMHPRLPLLAAATASGRVHLYS